MNNNAAAVLLALNTLAEGGEVIVSRGELVEIGGSFRIPDVMAKSGAMLREVGTTNRTRAADYENAINERTRLLLRVHRSNFEITGFTEQATTAELVALCAPAQRAPDGRPGQRRARRLAEFRDQRRAQRARQPARRRGRRNLQRRQIAGRAAGRLDQRTRRLVARMRANSLFRALRVDKLTYAALEATLLAYVKRDHDAIPTLRMMRLTKEEIGERAESFESRRPVRKVNVEIVDGESVIGGGAAPRPCCPRGCWLDCADLSADELAARLRASDPPIIARVEEGRVLLDLRTVFPEQDHCIAPRSIESSCSLPASKS